MHDARRQLRWIQHFSPRLGCCLGVLPSLQRLFIRRAKTASMVSNVLTPLAETATLAIAGALQAGACSGLHHLNIDERLPEDKVAIIARAMHPNGGLLFGASDFRFCALMQASAALASVLTMRQLAPALGLPAVWVGLGLYMALRAALGSAHILSGRGVWRVLIK